MAVRNFWIEADVDGRKTSIAFGPRAKDGGFRLLIYQRDKGHSKLVFTVSGIILQNGRLCTEVTSEENEDDSLECFTER